MTKFDRRRFLGISVVAGAGLGLGFGWPILERLKERDKSVNPLGAGDMPSELEPWIRISPDNAITVTISRSEMGQGVETALAMIVAEELDADWSDMRTQQAKSDPAYGNQHTAASSSIQQLWAPMREAAATARRMLMSAAAEEWGIDVDHCATSDSQILHPDGQRQMSFGSIAEKAAQLSIPINVQLKKVEDFKIVGQRRSRLDVPAKVDGAAIFGWDVEVPNMSIAAVTRCPTKGGHVAEFNSDEALQIDGVSAVVPIKDPYGKSGDSANDAPYAVAVVGNSYWAVKQGQAVLKVSWNEGSNAKFDSASIAAMLARWANSDGGDIIVDRGDINEASTQSDSSTEAIYEVPYLAHVTMSPTCCTADVRADECDVWAPTQSPDLAQRMVRKFTEFPRRAITIHKTYLGGGFGRRQRQDYVGDVVQISQAVRKPVKLLSSRRRGYSE